MFKEFDHLTLQIFFEILIKIVKNQFFAKKKLSLDHWKVLRMKNQFPSKRL